MNVLLISQAFPPYPVVGALRARKLASALRAQGHRVFVVTERLPGEGDGLRVDEPGLKVHTVALGPPYRLRALSLLRRNATRQGPAAPAAAAGGEGQGSGEAPYARASGGGWLRRLAVALLVFPDDEQRFVLPALRAARSLLRHDVDVVYTTAPEFSSHVVGLLLRRRAGVRWVAEFRDPWTDARLNVDAPRIALVEAMHRWLERRVLRAADVVVAVTEGARRALASKVPERERGKFVVALNGIDELSAARTNRREGPLRIVYAGTFYHHRDPRPFLHALARLRARRGFGPADVEVTFAGRCRAYADVSVEAAVAEHGLSDVVRFVDWMSHDEAQAMSRDADLLFLIALRQPLQVPNKLFDYLGARRPILAVVDEGGESERMLREVGGHLVVSVPRRQQPDAAAMERALEGWLDAAREDRATPAPSSEATLQGWLASRQLEGLVHAIGG